MSFGKHFIQLLVVFFTFLAICPQAQGQYRHKRLFSEAFMHEPVRDEKCSVCHDVHFSDLPAQLIESPPGLCFLCHDSFDGKVVHSPVGDGKCMECHYPHAASIKNLLPRPVETLCLKCHQEKKNGMHGQVRMSRVHKMPRSPFIGLEQPPSVILDSGL
jgi:predicted CXXCH cytochrome family protein